MPRDGVRVHAQLGEARDRTTDSDASEQARLTRTPGRAVRRGGRGRRGRLGLRLGAGPGADAGSAAVGAATVNVRREANSPKERRGCGQHCGGCLDERGLHRVWSTSGAADWRMRGCKGWRLWCGACAGEGWWSPHMPSACVGAWPRPAHALRSR